MNTISTIGEGTSATRKRRTTVRKSLLAGAAAAAFSSVLSAITLVPAVGAQEAAPATPKLTNVEVVWMPGKTYWGGMTVPRATSSLARFEEGASASLATAGLEPGHTVTLWWVVFNHPEKCTHGQAPIRCGEGDLLIAGGDPAVEGTVLYATGHLIGPAGEGHFSGYLAPDDASYVLGQGPGLTNPIGADIHLVVRTHGPVQPGLISDQLGTFGGGCNNAQGMPPAGAPGDYACVDLQFAAHEVAVE